MPSIKSKAEKANLEEGEPHKIGRSTIREWTVTDITDLQIVTTHLDGTMLILECLGEKFKVIRKSPSGDEFKLTRYSDFSEALRVVQTYALAYTERDEPRV